MKCKTHKESKKSKKPSDICNTRIDLRASLGGGINAYSGKTSSDANSFKLQN